MENTLLGVALGLGTGFLLAVIYFLIWKAKYTKAIRSDAVQRSLAVTTGKVHEQLLPYFPGFTFNPKDVRFLGSPVDFVVFDGLSNGRLERVVFLEVKTGDAVLSGRERQIREVVEAGRVEWEEWRAESARLRGRE
ncbi:MAG: Holliday junction resolvase-like protein [Gemmatimonadota bacterium]